MGMFFRRGTTGVRFVPTIVNIASPTAAEITAGTDLGPALAAMEGFETKLNRINQPLLKYKQEVQIDGPQQFGDAKLTLIEDDGTGATGDDLARKNIYIALPEQATGFIVINPVAQTFVATGASLGTVTVAITTGVLTVSAVETLAVGDAVQLGTMTGGAPLVAGTTYYVQSVPTSTTLTLSATPGGVAIATTSAGSSTSIVKLTGAKVEVWPIRIGSKNRDFSLGTEPGRYIAELAISGAQEKNAVVA